MVSNSTYIDAVLSSSEASLAIKFEQKKDTGGSLPLVSFMFVAIQLAG